MIFITTTTYNKFDKLIHINANDGFWTWTEVMPNVEIKTADGNTSTYVVMAATYKGNGDVHPNGVLPAGETTRPSLLQVFLDATATNDHAEAIDGTINLTPGSFTPAIVFEGNGSIDKIIYNGTEYTQAEWLAR